MAQFGTENIRTLALVGHGASGKTTLAEALLLKSGSVQVAGSVERGSAISDFDPLERSWQHSLRASVLHLEAQGTRVHMIDTPGFPDFIGQSIGALDAVETAAVVINAAAGIEMIASRMMEWAAQRKLCRLIIVNKIDAENVDLPGLLTSISPHSARNACRSIFPRTTASGWSIVFPTRGRVRFFFRRRRP